MYVEGVGQKSGPCTATFNDLLCLGHLPVTFIVIVIIGLVAVGSAQK
jgi:hypothetical protein